MIKCPTCAFENPDDGKFCTACGKTLAAPPPATNGPEGPARFCTECGAKVPADSKFCTACGKGFEGGAAAGSGGRVPPGDVPAPVLAGGAGGARVRRGLSRRPRRAAGRQRLREDRPAGRARPRPLPAPEEVRAGPGRHGHGGLRRQGPDRSGDRGLRQGLQQGGLRVRRLQEGLLRPERLAAAPRLPRAHRPRGRGRRRRSSSSSHWPKHWMAFEFPVVVSLGDAGAPPAQVDARLAAAFPRRDSGSRPRACSPSEPPGTGRGLAG